VARIVLNTLGSLGDLHPYLAIAIELRRRGHQPVIATSEVYRRKILAEDVAFAPVRPDVGLVMDDPEFIARVWDRRRGGEFLLRDYLVPHL
jgi:rhamnosyltransferase subunit B